jgi:hypothetical protein
VRGETICVAVSEISGSGLVDPSGGGTGATGHVDD